MSFTRVRSSYLPGVTVSVVLTVCFLAGPVSHAASSPEVAGKVSRLMDASGITHSVRQIQPGIVGGFDQPQQGMPDNVRRALRDAASQAFQPGPIIERVRARLGAALTVRHLDDALAWLDSPIGRRITDLENAAAEPAAMAQIQAYAGELGRRPPPKRRTDLIAELIVATGSGEFNAAILESAVLATALGINAAQPVQQQAPVDALRKQVASSLPQLRSQSEQLMTVSMLYTYRTLTDQDLESYLNFLQSSSGTAYTQGAVAGLREAMLEAMALFMQAIPKALSRQGRSQGT